MTLCQAWKWNEAEQEFHRALALNANSANTHYFYAVEFLIAQKRLDQALAELRTAMSLDPLSPIINTNYASVLTMAHRYGSRSRNSRGSAGRPRFKPAITSYRCLYAATDILARP